MGAATSPADPAAEAGGTPPRPPRAPEAPPGGSHAPDADERAAGEAGEAGEADAADAADAAGESGASGEADTDAAGETGTAGQSAESGGEPGAPRSRRFPSFTRDTARPEGGGRAAPGDAPAPARQWPLLAVLCTAGIGLLIVAVDPFAEAFRVGTMLIGCALLGGAVLRLVVPSVGMLAVRSRFTDLVTYGLLGFLIVMLALVAQPKPWLDIPFLEQAVHFTIR
ncbi:DUF3017 domain-containing protein [Streptomyces sp. NPDC056347]|uniref:DUF3017 domain-containing protein n=1 Tax=Streptomyces sp. NPDC056347 TaxID=3345790 RepID=UPI0035E3A8DB